MNNELQHFGVKGMKWGVRRYQNYDGTYTQKGLKRYRESQAKYDAADDKLKAARASGDKAAIKIAKNKRINANLKLYRDYKKIKKGHSIDEGEKLHQQGQTINSVKKKYGVSGIAIGLGAAGLTGAINFIAKTGMNQSYKSFIAPAAVAVGAAVTADVMLGLQRKKISDLRAYYEYSEKAKS